MEKSIEYISAAEELDSLGSVVPKELAEYTSKALSKLKDALDGDVCGYVTNRLHMSPEELGDALAAEQVDGVALAMYNIEKKSQSVIIGDQTGIGKGRQAAAMIRYGLLSGYLPIFFTDRYTLFSDMYRDCKALGIKNARPLVVNAGVSVFDFDKVVEEEGLDTDDEIWSPVDDEDNAADDDALMQVYQKQYEVVYKAPKKKVLQGIFESGDIPTDSFDYLMITYSQLKDAKRDATRLDFLHSLCEKHRVLFIFDEAHRSSSVSAGKLSVITQGINMILSETPKTQCVFLSATFAKRPESFITFMRRTALSALATESTLAVALQSGGVPMQEYVSSTLAAEGQMIRREHSSEGIPAPVYTYLDDEIVLHSELFDKVMYYFREAVKLSARVQDFVNTAQLDGLLADFKCYPTRSQLFYINKVLLLALKAQKVAQVAVEEVKRGRSVVIGMSDTLECILRDVQVLDEDNVRGDFSSLLLRLIDKTVSGHDEKGNRTIPLFEMVSGSEEPEMQKLLPLADELREHYSYFVHSIQEDVFHLPMSPIDVIRQLITKEQFTGSDGRYVHIRFEECTGRAHQLEYLSPEGDDDFVNAVMRPRKKRHSNHIFNDFQNNKIDVILINACGAIGASAHAISTTEVPDEQVRQRKMLIVQNDLDVNIDLQKRGRINRTGQRMDLPPLYEYIITAIPSEKRLNMMLRAKLRSLSANTAGWQDQDKDQADFIDISNKYGNDVATEYLSERQELALVLGLSGKVTASRLLARIAMLSVTAQQEIVDDLMTAYIALEAELRRINQWDLEKEFRDFEAEFVREELFTTAKADSSLGGCSYLSSYKCRQKTFPYPFKVLKELCDQAGENFGAKYDDNLELQTQVRKYYMAQNKNVRQRFKERRELLYVGTKRTLSKYCNDENQLDAWLEKACVPTDEWTNSYFEEIDGRYNVKKIVNKLISYSNEYNHLLEREKKELKKNAEEKKRLVTVLSKAEIGKGYRNVSHQFANEEYDGRVIAVLRDIRFGKEDKNRFRPGLVEFVFALTAISTETRINLVHNRKWSNYSRLLEILNSQPWTPQAGPWDSEIALNNKKIVERKIITGNILGAFVHPAIAMLKPRFITFTLKNKAEGAAQTQKGLLLPMDESKIREALKTVSVPLNEGVKYATDVNTAYPIVGVGIDFSLMPYRTFKGRLKFVISVMDHHSKLFENDKRFDEIRPYFTETPITSSYDRKGSDKQKHKVLKHYKTEELLFESETFQTIVQLLSQMGAVIIVPRDQMKYGDVKEYISRAERDENEPWEKLDWKNADAVPMPPIKEKLLLRISAPIVAKVQKGKAVAQHSEYYNLAKETVALRGLPMDVRSTRDELRRCYMNWLAFYNAELAKLRFTGNQNALYEYKKILTVLRYVIENWSKAAEVEFSPEVNDLLQKVLDSEHLDVCGEFTEKFGKEMLFLSPEKSEAQWFLDDMPCDPRLDGIRRCIQDYIDGKTDIINSPDRW